VTGSGIRGRSSERIAQEVLEELGYKILETNWRVVVDGAEAFEVDILAVSSEGEEYCVEVKAGRASVSDVRQVFADSRVLDMKPLLISKGYSDEAAEALAKEFGVEMIKLNEYYLLLEPEELEIIMRKAIRDILDEYGFYPLPPQSVIMEEDWRLIQAVAEAEDFERAAETLKLNPEELGERIGEMRSREIFPRRSQAFSELKRCARQLSQRYSVVQRLNLIEKRLREI